MSSKTRRFLLRFASYSDSTLSQSGGWCNSPLSNIGTSLIIRIGFGVYYAILIIRKARTLRMALEGVDLSLLSEGALLGSERHLRQAAVGILLSG